jgi:hypothetical protein
MGGELEIFAIDAYVAPEEANTPLFILNLLTKRLVEKASL